MLIVMNRIGGVNEMQYKIVTATSLEDLESKVNESLSGDWRLQGGVAIQYVYGNTYFAQSMKTNNMSLRLDSATTTLPT